MPQNKDLKRVVRARMADTGERYTEAMSALAGDHQPAMTSGRWASLVDALAKVETYHSVFAELKALPAKTLLPLAVAGSRHQDWRVRRGCCLLLDDLAFTDESFAALEERLSDPEARVRRAAVHSLSCGHCKPEGCVVEVRPVFERALRDPSRRVRQMVVGPLGYGPEEGWRLDLLRQVAEADPSQMMRRWAQGALDAFEARRASDLARQRLDPELMAKTQRHPGRWVAISGGRIIDVGGHPGAMERTARKHGYQDVIVYWVRP